MERATVRYRNRLSKDSLTRLSNHGSIYKILDEKETDDSNGEVEAYVEEVLEELEANQPIKSEIEISMSGGKEADEKITSEIELLKKFCKPFHHIPGKGI